MPTHSTFRQSTTWDPVLILSQITTLQCFGYSTFGFLLFVGSFLAPVQLTPGLLFDGTLVRGDTVSGWTIAAGFLSMAATNILALVYMVERSRLCIDFTVTFFVIHFVLVVWLYGIPTSFLWWLVMGASAGIMAFGGRAACMRREMLPIAIRNFMPDHPVEQRPRDEMAVEEHELESRVPESTGRGNSEPEVLFSAPKDIDDDRISPDAANATASSSNNNANSTAKTSAKAAGLSLSGSKDKSGSSNKNDGGDDDDWNDNWGEEDEEEIVSMPGPKPSASLTANKQAKND